MRRTTTTAINALREDLREWAKWHHAQLSESEHSGSGWSDTTVIGRAASGLLHQPPGPRIPDGVIPPSGIAPVVHAMRELMGVVDLAPYVGAVREFYRCGEDATAVMRAYGVRLRTANDMRQRGEHVILAFLRA